MISVGIFLIASIVNFSPTLIPASLAILDMEVPVKQRYAKVCTSSSDGSNPEIIAIMEIILSCMYHTVVRFVGIATGRVKIPPKLVTNPDVVHFLICHLTKLSMALSGDEYLDIYSSAKS